MMKIVIILLLQVAPADLERIKSEHFTVFFERGSRNTAEICLSAAETAYKKVEKNIGVKVNSTVYIRVSRGKGTFGKDQPAPPGAIPEWAVGTAYPSRRIIFIRHPEGVKITYDDITAVVMHEYSHIALGNALEGIDIPIWLDEGIADFVAGSRSWTASFTIGSAAITGRLFSFDSLKYWWPKSGDEAQIAYAQCANFIFYIERNYGPGAVKRLVEEIKRTGDVDKSIVSVTGKERKKIENEWFRHVSRIYRWIPLLSGGLSLWVIASILVIIGHARKKRLNNLKIEMWDMEDRLRGLKYHEDDDSEDEDEDEETPDKPVYH